MLIGLAPLIVPVRRDPYFANVMLLVQGEGADGSTAILDSSSYNRALTRVTSGGAVNISTAAAKFGASSLYFGGGRITTPYDSGWIIGNRPITVEAWMRCDNLSSQWGRHLFTRAFSGNNYFHCGISSDGRLRWNINDGTGGPSTIAANPLTLGVFHHCAWVRNGTSWRIYQDGVMVCDHTETQDLNSTNTTVIGVGGEGHSDGTSWFGYVQGLRVTLDVARYLGNFTPPPEPFPTR